MGGVDLFDQFVSKYRLHIKSKKWWQPFFALAENVSISNPWNLFHTVQKQKIGMLEFQIEDIMTFMASFGRNNPETLLAFPRNVANSVKLDTRNHILVKGNHNIAAVNTVVVDQSIYARNAMLPYTLTVSKTIIHETQNLLYCFLLEVLIM